MIIDELTEAKFNPLQFKDEYREQLLHKIRAKSQGKTITAEEPEKEKGGEVIDIMEALRRSLQGGRAPAKRAPARKKTAAASRTQRATHPQRTASKKRKAS